MKAVVHIVVGEDSNSLLLDKVAELGYVTTHVWTSPTFQVYQINMTEEDLIMLRLMVPTLEVTVVDENDPL
jgi:hypothetical protein